MLECLLAGRHRPLGSPSGADASDVSFGHAESCGCDCAVDGNWSAEGRFDGLDEGLANHGRWLIGLRWSFK